MTRASAAARLAGVVVAAALAVASPVLAHEGEQHAARDPVGGPIALFLAGLVVLGSSAYLDANGAVSRRAADAGVGLGLLAVLVAIPWYWL